MRLYNFSTVWINREILEPNRFELFIWLPLFLGAGIVTYFHTSVSISPKTLVILGCVTACISVPAFLFHMFTRWLAIFLLTFLIGYCAAQYRTYVLNAPVLQDDVRSAVLGRIVWIDRSSNYHPRLKLDNLRAVSFGEVIPRYLMVSLIDQDSESSDILKPGMYVRLGLVFAGPPPSPTESGAFDYRFYAWFKQIGGVGYTRSPPIILANDAPNEEFSIKLARWRKEISYKLQSLLDGQSGAVAAALTVGDRYALSQETIENLRISGLAHLLSISGLHIGVVTMFVYALLRWGLCLLPGIGRRYPLKKIAAIFAILAGALYTVLAVTSLPTQRAFIMACLAFGAVLYDQRAITMQSLSVAAMVLLIWQPESLLQVGFQLSFIATASLVIVYQHYSIKYKKTEQPIVRKIVVFLLGVLFTSFVAGLATSPVIAYHFNRLPSYSLLGNFMAMPVFTIIVVPFSFLSAFTGIVGLHTLPLFIVEKSINFILWTASLSASLPKASVYIKGTTPFVFTFLMLGMCSGLLVKGYARLVSISIFCIGLIMWYNTPRPDILIAPNTQLAGVLTSQGRSVSSNKRQKFLSERWLEKDGEYPDVNIAFARTNEIKGGLILNNEATRKTIFLKQQKYFDALCQQAHILIIRPIYTSKIPEGCNSTILTNNTDRTLNIYLNKDNVPVRKHDNKDILKPWLKRQYVRNRPVSIP